ncbi:Putative sensor histidine kinase [Streptomyces venezuelae]|uniref:sensor histidine kinase n=1 Tax=Streptomyces gardneri TaxID=66892 RepID=UPI0006BDAB23|nr:nitrate- and nitrite sensing domain-containing protein [Streptomyces gardneri]ALO06993.1 Putative sensor histidine kinase [Streptomyces venezuelae]QPK44359.1 nitrate- and nitrite sensing domain-containing protein [Streptomyces gardneri]WRK35653.1 nitrate- and nitrite sensing domain-containing protein [Streptomyces venezuelae]CUM42706.1 putative sensor-like histidine kinase [Streptomyces venezuelae]
MRFRGKSIRRKIVALLLVPLVSLTGLWAFATVLTGREADQLLDVAYIVEKVGYPLEDTARVIQLERRQSLVYLADPRGSTALASLRETRRATDRQISRIRANAADPGVREEMRPVTTQRLNSLLEALDDLESLRRSVEKRSIGRIQALEFYNRLVDPCYSFLITLHALENVEMDKQGRALVGITRAREVLSREDALVLSALVADRITAPELRAMSDLVANREQFYEVNLELLPTAERERFEKYWASPETAALRAAEKAIIDEGPTDEPRAVTAAYWQEEASPVLDDLARENTAAGDRYQDRVQPAAYSVLLKVGVAGVLGFLALLASIVISVRIGRSLVHDLRRLQKEAQEVSGVRLPSVMRRLAAGEHVDVRTEVPHLRYGEDEVGQVGQALNTLQRAAVEAAVKQSELRRGVSEVFVNLARRNQVLLHRQLTLLDTMERRTEDTDELADLFRLDHLTTRMRRHAEGLVILSGAAASRQWRKPVQLMDVVRAAVAEVEDYERIEVRRLPRLGVGGPAVADLTHLIAELLENATVFSPPHTAVQVLGERVANGFTLEIHDRGLGMNADALLDANLRLAETPEFELSDTDRLGLFVVSRLAQRQNVRVSLQTSPYGGTTAVVFIPAALLTDAPETQGAGFRLDRKSVDRDPVDARTLDGKALERAGHADGSGRLDGDTDVPTPLPTRRPVLARVPDVTEAPGVLDGPVELEAPLDADEFDVLFDRSADILDTESERGGLFRPRDRRRSGLAPAGEQHQQAPDQTTGRGEDDAHADGAVRGPVPLPRRSTPTLIVDRGRRVDEPGRSHPAVPDAGPVPVPVQGPTLVPVPPEGPVAAEAPEPFGGLPRRVRQANLAPQLRETEGPADRGTGAGADDRTAVGAAGPESFERDAEEVRARMAAMQRGWQRGRRHTADPDDTSAPGTTPEGDGR